MPKNNPPYGSSLVLACFSCQVDNVEASIRVKSFIGVLYAIFNRGDADS